MTRVLLLAVGLCASLSLYASERYLGQLIAVERTFSPSFEECEKVFVYRQHEPWSGSCVVQVSKPSKLDTFLYGNSVHLPVKISQGEYKKKDLSCLIPASVGRNYVPLRIDPEPREGFSPEIVIAPLANGYQISVTEVPYCLAIEVLKRAFFAQTTPISIEAVVQTVR
jgi:hypothetical protein